MTVLGTIHTLCDICNRLVIISESMLNELRSCGTDRKKIETWERELKHLYNMVRKLK